MTPAERYAADPHFAAMVDRVAAEGATTHQVSQGATNELIDLVTRTTEDVWLVEIVLDTGQRYQSDDLCGRAAAQRELEDMRGRAMVVVVTMIELSTGEAITRPSRNLAAGVLARTVLEPWRERALLAEALGGAAS